MLSWNYPPNNGLKANIDAYALYPITTLTSLTKKDKQALIDNDIILVKELNDGENVLNAIGLSEQKTKKVLEEVHNLCQMNLDQ